MIFWGCPSHLSVFPSARYSLYSAVSTVSPECLTPHLTAITTVMLLALKSNEGITVQSAHRTLGSSFLNYSVSKWFEVSLVILLFSFEAHLEEDKTFVLLDDDDDDDNDDSDNNEGKAADEFLEDEPETDVHDVAGSVPVHTHIYCSSSVRDFSHSASFHMF